MRVNLTFLTISICMLVSGCNSDTWTERYSMGGFSRPFETYINFEKGGKILFTANASSELYKSLEGEIEIQIRFDGEICAEAKNSKFTNELLVSAKCDLELSPGRHDFRVDVISEEAEKLNLVQEKDWEYNSIHGEETMTMYK